MAYQNLRVLKTVNDNEKASLTIDSYEDSLTEYYNYDSFVANSQQIENKDLAVIINKVQILGFAEIGSWKCKSHFNNFG